MVPFESSEQSAPLCCNLEHANLSRFINLDLGDAELNEQSVLPYTTNSRRRIPALLAQVVPVPE